jgi:hypothetical protein
MTSTRKNPRHTSHLVGRAAALMAITASAHASAKQAGRVELVSDKKAGHGSTHAATGSIVGQGKQSNSGTGATAKKEAGTFRRDNPLAAHARAKDDTAGKNRRVSPVSDRASPQAAANIPGYKANASHLRSTARTFSFATDSAR